MSPEGFVLPVHTASAAAFVRDDRDRLLLVKHPRRGWTIPGGMVEQGETLPQAAVREILEETGVTAEIGELCLVSSNVGKRPGYNGVKEIPTTVNFVFLARAVAGEPRPSEENSESGWFTLEQAKEMIQHPVHVRSLQAYLDYQGRPCYLAYKTWPEFELLDKRTI